MAKRIDFSSYSFSADQVRDINECIVEELLLNPLLNSVFGRIETGVKNGKEIGFIKSDMGLMLKTGQIGCNPTDVTMPTLNTYKKTWALKSAYFRGEECETTSRNTFLDLAKKSGMDRYKLTESEYYALLQTLIADNLAKNIFLKAWFDDTAILNVSGGGVLKNGVSTTLLDTIDGIFKQLKAIYTTTPARRTTITENGGVSYATQAITNANCTAVFNNLLQGADPRLANASDKIYISTRSLVQGYRWDMQSKGTDSLMQKQIDGVTVDMCNGIPIIEVGVWDEFIRAYFDNGTKWDNPHRAILTTKDQLALAFSSDGAFDNFDVFFDRKSKLNIVEGEDQYDAKCLLDYMFQVAI